MKYPMDSKRPWDSAYENHQHVAKRPKRQEDILNPVLDEQPRDLFFHCDRPEEDPTRFKITSVALNPPIPSPIPSPFLPEINVLEIDSPNSQNITSYVTHLRGNSKGRIATPSTPLSELASLSPSLSDCSTVRSVDRCFGSIDVRLRSIRGFKRVQTDCFAKLTRTLDTTLTLYTVGRGLKSTYIGIIPRDLAQTMAYLVSEVSIEIDPYIPPQELQSDSETELLVCCQLYGSSENAQGLTEYLNENDIFLQDPVKLRKSISYVNPQAWVVPVEVQQMLDEELSRPLQEEFKRHENEIASIFDEDSQPLPVSADEEPWDGINISNKITTSLLETQLLGVNYMALRERRPWFLPTLWKRQPNFYSYSCELTDQTIYTEPPIPRGGILADEMGLGKSLTTLALITSILDFPSPEERLSTVKTTLLITPTITIASWKEQLSRHTSGITVLFYLSRKMSRLVFTSYDLIITTYGMISAEKRGNIQYDSLQGTRWFRIILDEAHTIRSRSAAQSKLICSLNAERRWCLTGTPTQNKLDDLGSLLQFLRLRPIDTRREFTRSIVNPLKHRQPRGLENLRRLIAATTLRRTKKRLVGATALPERHDLIQQLVLTDDEMKLYKFIINETRRQIQKALDSGSCSIRMASQCLIRLRQACNASALLPQQILDSFEKERIIDESSLTCMNACENCGDEIERSPASFDCGHIVCPQCSLDGKNCPLCHAVEELDQDELIQQDLCETPGILTPQPPQPTRVSDESLSERSSKVKAVVNNLLRNKRSAEQPKSVVFACWTRMLDIIGEALDDAGIEYTRLNGSMSLKARITEIKRFREDYNIHVLLITIGSGSVGLDLTAASQVHLVEPQYNPMQEEQALARVHRIGQTKPVTTVRYIVENTYETEIQALQEEKTMLAELCGAGKDGKDGRTKLERLKAVLK